MKTTTKKVFLSAMSIALSLFAVQAGTITVGTPGGAGGVEVKGTWTKGSTVIVNDHVIIQAGQSLTIEDGVTVEIADTTLKIEFILLGNLYCKGTASNPINITVATNKIPGSVPNTRPFPGLWGGIMCDVTCKEVLMLHTNIKYYGAATTNNSPSVLLKLYKAAAGETVPFMNFRNHIDGKLVIMNSTFSNGVDDGIYIEGGKVIFAYNKIYQNGSTGGDATNLKAGTIADLCYNMYYSQNTNAFKLSNTGSRSPQCVAVVYNNTIVNTGWRRPTTKGGSVWYEAGVVGKTYNTLFLNCRFGIKTDGKADAASTADYNYYYGNTQNTVNNFNTPTSGLLAHGANDVFGTTAGANDPMLVNYPLSTDTLNSKFDMSWDFHPKSGSPLINKGTTAITRNFGTAGSGITIQSVEYLSPAPSTTVGAFAVSTVGVNDLKTNQFGIFPNPVSTTLNITLDSNNSAKSLVVYNETGVKVIDQLIDYNSTSLTVPVAHLNAGVYTLSIIYSDNSQNSKTFIKR